MRKCAHKKCEKEIKIGEWGLHFPTDPPETQYCSETCIQDAAQGELFYELEERREASV